MSAKLKTISLCKLKQSPSNVRKTDRFADLESLSASIAANGLLENLVVKPAGAKFEVIAGGRRLAALKLLAKRKTIAKDHPVACLVFDGGSVLEVSLAENFARTHLHPADQFGAFAQLIADGMSIDEIAARFGVTPTFVQQRLKLAAVSPRLVAEYRSGAMTLEQLTAFTLCSDTDVQEAVWFESPGLPVQVLRRRLTSTKVEADDRRALLVGAEAYEAAGGTILRDLFDGGGYFEDSQLLDRLTAEKLQAVAETVRAEGWLWVEVHTEPETFARYARARTVEVLLDAADEERLAELSTRYDDLVAALEEEGAEDANAALDTIATEIDGLVAKKTAWPDDEKARSGAIVRLDSDGSIRIDRGLLKPEQVRAAQRAPKAPRADGYSEAVLIELSVHRTAALREALAVRPDVALTALLYALVTRLFGLAPLDRSIGIAATETELVRHAASVTESRAQTAFEARHVIWRARLPEPAMLWDWLAQLDAADRGSLLAHSVAMTVNAVAAPGACTDVADVLARAVGLDMRDWWRPTRATFLDRLTKAEILAAVAEGVSPDAARRLEDAKKADMAKRAEALLAQTDWLPAPFRSAPAEDASSIQA